MSDDILTVTIQKRAGETLDRIFDLRPEILRAWRRGVEYSAAEFVRPSSPNGYDYECTTGGRTAQREPRWPTTVAATVLDGSLTWTCRAPNSGSQDQLSGSATLTVPSGITATHLSTEPTGDVLLRFAGGTEDQDYSVLASVNTVAGQVIEFEIVVEVQG
jgi:hypothetical protein